MWVMAECECPQLGVSLRGHFSIEGAAALFRRRVCSRGGAGAGCGAQEDVKEMEGELLRDGGNDERLSNRLQLSLNRAAGERKRVTELQGQLVSESGGERD
jgi:hypothetical protein